VTIRLASFNIYLPPKVSCFSVISQVYIVEKMLIDRKLFIS